MVKTVLGVEGMACSMCEAHINDAIRRVFPAKSVVSDRKKKETVILSEDAPEEALLRKTVEDTGYQVTSFRSEPYEKKGFSLFRKRP